MTIVSDGLCWSHRRRSAQDPGKWKMQSLGSTQAVGDQAVRAERLTRRPSPRGLKEIGGPSVHRGLPARGVHGRRPPASAAKSGRGRVGDRGMRAASCRAAGLKYLQDWPGARIEGQVGHLKDDPIIKAPPKPGPAAEEERPPQTERLSGPGTPSGLEHLCPWGSPTCSPCPGPARPIPAAGPALKALGESSRRSARHNRRVQAGLDVRVPQARGTGGNVLAQ